MAYLHEKGWAENLSASFSSSYSGSVNLLDMRVNLTEEGLEHYKEVVNIIFQYISLLRAEPLQKWRFEEFRFMDDTNFKWQEKTSSIDFTKNTSLYMQDAPEPRWLLSWPSRLREFDAPSIEKALVALRPDNFRMTIVSRKFPGDWDQEEKWYGTEFRVERIPKEFMAEIQNAATSTASGRIRSLHLPEKNPYIPTNLEILNKDIEKSTLAPHLVRKDDMLAWFKQDDTFKVPKAHVFLNFCNPVTYSTAKNAVKARLLVDLVEDALQSQSHYAAFAGLRYSLWRDATGMCLNLYGYNDKLVAYLEQILIKIKHLEIIDERFNMVQNRLALQYSNWELRQPFLQVSDYTTCLNSQCDYTIEELLVELPDLTAESIREYKEELFSKTYITAYFLGNLSKENVWKVTDMVNVVLAPCHPPQFRLPVDRSLAIPPGSDYVYKITLKDLKNSNNCIEFWLYTGKQGDRLARVKTMLFHQMCDESAFDHFRTKEQLGYIVMSESRSASDNYGLSFIIQSEKTPEDIDVRVDAFLDLFSNKLKDMPEEVFQNHKRSLRVKLLRKCNNLGEESYKHWEQIVTANDDFEQDQRDAEEVENLKQGHMTEFFEKYIKPGSKTRAKIAVHLSPGATAEGRVNGDETKGRPPNPVCIKNISEFRAEIGAMRARQLEGTDTKQIECFQKT
ncbi:A-pheromone processing metallopeptidase Ste23 [Colletotrichum tofieldiae]|uniref:A-pheromone processing metallopeptidase Ste23 n=1 Tax=Colletotrichum tofieldiae TaxID=708197 RepID=A0A161WHU4_9PEZI|nr:A-pheromone processing metallopeptidase Ste23 [Colletotrichum tofieldiae]GKT61114.1 A-pheromone processing metallopeptidase Ste23 [Colletotrichum tofieldiae]GKT68796.1 A-pheromone processing metallopeptidase Ste23 [Colletotrichum tofieldiae]GKT88565.1 A-pheromone processing metallopeptidase Ste23 [Colletotrichum tofieldiae]